MSLLSIINISRFFKDISKASTSFVTVYSRCYSERSKKIMKESPLKPLLDDAVIGADDLSNDPNNEWTSQSYPEILRKKIENESAISPEDMCILLFPGQGTQYLGMGKDLLKFPRARDVFELAHETLKIDLLNITRPEDVLKYSQELVVVNSLAALEKLKEERPSIMSSCVATAGFSLGEITALIVSGAIPMEQGLRLVSLRSAAMEAASKESPGGMMTIIYTPQTNINKMCQDAVDHCMAAGKSDAFCTVANYLYPSCKVLSGTEEVLQYIQTHMKEYGIVKSRRLNVSGAFHSQAVQSAVEPFRQALRLCNISHPQIRVMSSVTGKHYASANHIRSLLPKQIISPVKWEQLLHNLYSRSKDDKYPRTFEVGPGQTLRAMLRKVNAKAWDSSFSVTA